MKKAIKPNSGYGYLLLWPKYHDLVTGECKEEMCAWCDAQEMKPDDGAVDEPE